jgi:hypothetical protein
MKPMSSTEAAGAALEFFKLKERIAKLKEQLKKERENNAYLQKMIERERTINGDERMMKALEEISTLKRALEMHDKLLKRRIKNNQLQSKSYIDKYGIPQLILSKRLHREIAFHLHPDRWDGEAKARAEKCMAEFNSLKAKLYEEGSP